MTARVGMLDDVAAERLGLADDLEALTLERWATPSLCAGWTVHDVVAHLTLSTRQSVSWTLWRVARARGDLERAFADIARERAAAFGPEELIAQLRDMAHVDRRLAISGELDPLNDLLVHSQDVAIPLGRGRDLPVERALPCLRHVWAAPFVGAAARFTGLRLRARRGLVGGRGSRGARSGGRAAAGGQRPCRRPGRMRRRGARGGAWPLRRLTAAHWPPC